MKLPKVLILGHSFSATGGGITMTNLFADWDKDKIAVACTGHFLNMKMNVAVCDTYYQLGEKEHKMIFPLNYLQKKFSSGPVKLGSSQLTKDGSIKTGLRHKFVNKIFYPSLEYLGLFHGMSRIYLSLEFRKWLTAYKPDIIYAQAFSLEGIRFAIEVKEYLKIPMAFHMMDDWPSSISEKGPFKKIWSKKIDFLFRNLLDKTSLLLSISDDMSTEYRQRYGKEFIPFHNPIDVNLWKKFQKTNYEFAGNPTVLYAGRIGIGIDSSLKLIAKAVEKVNQELNLEIKFVLRTEEKPAWINSYSCVEHKKYVPYKDIPKTLSEADILILPYDFSEASIRFIKYSMPTKASEYMMSGTPTILFAPAGTAIVNYAKKYNCFETTTNNSVDELSLSLKNVITSRQRRQSLANKAALIAEQKHSSEKITFEFKKALSSIY